jgi:hypothetical protein
VVCPSYIKDARFLSVNICKIQNQPVKYVNCPIVKACNVPVVDWLYLGLGPNCPDAPRPLSTHPLCPTTIYGSPVGIAAGHRLDGPRIESRWGQKLFQSLIVHNYWLAISIQKVLLWPYGYNTLCRHLHLMGWETARSAGSVERRMKPLPTLCRCEAVASSRHAHLGSFFWSWRT